LKSDIRKLHSLSVNYSEDRESLAAAKAALAAEKEGLRCDSRTLANLRSEHARLKDDFRSLFTSNERVKSEFCVLQSDYKALKTTYNQMKLQQTSLKGELNEAREQLALMDVEHSKAINRSVRYFCFINKCIQSILSLVTILVSSKYMAKSSRRT